MENMPSWCGREILPDHFGEKLKDGQKIVSESLVRIYAYFHPKGDVLESWLEAKKWFENQKYEIVPDEEFDEHKFRAFEIPGNCLG